MTLPILELGGVSVSRAGAPVLHEISLNVGAGETVALLGANGAGKSTLLRALMGLVPLTAGTINFAGRQIGDLSTEARARLGIGYVPEGRRVFPGLTVRENLDVAGPGSAAERRRRRESLYALLPQLAERQDEAGWRLSGGQQQMLAMGRALMAAPSLLLLDEPSLGLAPKLARDVFAALASIAAGGAAIVLAEQNAALALSVAGRGIVLRHGHVAVDGDAAAVRRAPELSAGIADS